MQFRDQANRTQVLAYRGYNKEKKRAEVKLLGSFDRITLAVPDELFDSLQADEKEELLSHIENIRHSRGKSMRHTRIKVLPRHIEDVSDWLTDPDFDSMITPQYAMEVYASIDRLTKVLRRKGHRRPPRASLNQAAPAETLGSPVETSGEAERSPG